MITHDLFSPEELAELVGSGPMDEEAREEAQMVAEFLVVIGSLMLRYEATIVEVEAGTASCKAPTPELEEVGR